MTSPTPGRNAQTDTGVPRAGGAEGIDGQHPLLRCSARAEQGSRWVVVRKTGGAGQRGRWMRTWRARECLWASSERRRRERVRRIG
jgi:hypothetical protein